MKKIKLTQGKFALVDDEDFEFLNQFKWCLAAGGRYARTGIGPRKNNKKIYMHHLVLGMPKVIKGKIEVDHKNQNKLDNQKHNLRIINRSLNILNNFNPRKDNRSGFRGICLDKRINMWIASIQFEGRPMYLGRFNTPQEANEVYLDKLKSLI